MGRIFFLAAWIFLRILANCLIAWFYFFCVWSFVSTELQHIYRESFLKFLQFRNLLLQIAACGKILCYLAFGNCSRTIRWPYLRLFKDWLRFFKVVLELFFFFLICKPIYNWKWVDLLSIMTKLTLTSVLSVNKNYGQSKMRNNKSLKNWLTVPQKLILEISVLISILKIHKSVSFFENRGKIKASRSYSIDFYSWVLEDNIRL